MRSIRTTAAIVMSTVVLSFTTAVTAQDNNTLTVDMTWANFDTLWDAQTGTPVFLAPGAGGVTISLFSLDTGGGEVQSIYSHIVAGSIGAVSGSTLLGTTGWDSGGGNASAGIINNPSGTVVVDPGTDGGLGGPYNDGASPFIGDTIYAMFEVGGAYGYVFNSLDAPNSIDANSVSSGSWIIPDDTAAPVSISTVFGRNSTGDAGTYGTVVSGEAIDIALTVAGVGSGSLPSGTATTTGWHATNVPEPGTFALFGLGAVALMAYRRRRE